MRTLLIVEVPQMNMETTRTDYFLCIARSGALVALFQEVVSLISYEISLVISMSSQDYLLSQVN